ncbi:Peptidase inhibitor 15 [Taenia crassiceps]|uniref:Peptidase inhibitor 15 n=1 Tax=Taenia crassiceps TaxID=6207 RepID=A0ABR4QE63_9CEST
MIKAAGLLTALFVVAYALTEEERKIILDYHIQVRSKVQPSASNMMYMKYSKKLEAMAEKWVRLCKYEHPNPQMYPEYEKLGQNLAISGGTAQNIKWMSGGWAAEARYYGYANNTCTSGKICGHYTQMIWSSSKNLGCAINRCDNIVPQWPKPIYLLACQYSPPGNYRDKKPYKEGNACSKCPPFHTCVDKQCKRNVFGCLTIMIKAAIFLTALFVVAHALTEEERNLIVTYHKDTRLRVRPPAANMKLMTYSQKLENLAERWVARCEFEHPDTRIWTEYANTGQNLAITGGRPAKLKGMMKMWRDEAKDYSYDGDCMYGKVCGHYTQMVWANTSEVGCAIRQCDAYFPGWPSPVYLMACQYSPPGNWYGQKPYERGRFCTKCPPGTTCVDKQCARQ